MLFYLTQYSVAVNITSSLLMGFGFVALSGWASACQCVWVFVIYRTIYNTLSSTSLSEEGRLKPERVGEFGCWFVRAFFKTEFWQFKIFGVVLIVSHCLIVRRILMEAVDVLMVLMPNRSAKESMVFCLEIQQRAALQPLPCVWCLNIALMWRNQQLESSFLSPAFGESS